MSTFTLPCPIVHSAHSACSPCPPACRHTALFSSLAARAQNFQRRPVLKRRVQVSKPSTHGVVTVRAQTVADSLQETALQPVQSENGQRTAFPASAGVYAVYDKDQKIQYIGLSRKVAVSIANHVQDLPESIHSVKVGAVPDPSKENLTAAWKHWIQSAVEETGSIPPGNAPGANQGWVRKVPRAKPELKLTPGKGVQDLTCSVEDLLDGVVKSNKIVAFIKGTRTQPQCGFSYKVLTMLNEARVNYEVVNVLDEQFNPGLREAIKTYSQWPTIPQLYVKGEFVGGADIVEEMNDKGDLKPLLQ